MPSITVTGSDPQNLEEPPRHEATHCAYLSSHHAVQQPQQVASRWAAIIQSWLVTFGHLQFSGAMEVMA